MSWAGALPLSYTLPWETFPFITLRQSKECKKHRTAHLPENSGVMEHGMVEAGGSSLSSSPKINSVYWLSIRNLKSELLQKFVTFFFPLGIKTPGVVAVKHLFYNWAVSPASSTWPHGSQS